MTLYMTGKDGQLDEGRPSTEPLYSEGKRDQFPIPEEYRKVEYCDFISSHLENSGKILICQTICKDSFSAIFGPDKYRYYLKPAAKWSDKQSYDDLMEYIRREWKQGFQVSSLVADDNSGSFYVYMVKGLGKNQSIVTHMASVKDELKKGRRITSLTRAGNRQL